MDIFLERSIQELLIRYDKNRLAQEAIFHFLFHWTTMTVHSNVFENLLLIWLL